MQALDTLQSEPPASAAKLPGSAAPAVVQTCAKLGRQFNASPSQKALNRYVGVQHGMGKKANTEQSLWINIRKLSAQMDTLNRANGEAGFSTSAMNNYWAAKSMGGMMSKLVDNLPVKETQSEGFREELRYHLGKMCEWGGNNRSTWALAGEFLQRHEAIEVNGEPLTQKDCIQKASLQTVRKYHP